MAWARELVHRGVQLPALLRAYRLGHGLVERRLEETAAELEIEPEVRWRVLARDSHFMFAYIDAICTALVDDYEQERARWIRGAAAARAELVTAIVERQPIDLARPPKVALRRLAAPRRADRVGRPPRAGQPSRFARAEATRWRRALGGGPVLTVPIGERGSSGRGPREIALGDDRAAVVAQDGRGRPRRDRNLPARASPAWPTRTRRRASLVASASCGRPAAARSWDTAPLS